eukprot:3552717-Prymnesium_polylepis.1
MAPEAPARPDLAPANPNREEGYVPNMVKHGSPNSARSDPHFPRFRYGVCARATRTGRSTKLCLGRTRSAHACYAQASSGSSGGAGGA